MDLLKNKAAETVCDKICLRMQRGMPKELARFTEIEVRQMPDYDKILAMSTSHFWARIAETVDREEETTSSKVASAPIPMRPLDYLLHAVKLCLPLRASRWIGKFILYNQIEVSVNRTRVTEKHYHIIPAYLEEKGLQYRFMSWGEDYYTGTREEWGDLVALRDAVLECEPIIFEGRCVGYDLKPIQRIMLQAGFSKGKVARLG